MNEEMPFPKTTTDVESEGAPEYMNLPIDEALVREMRTMDPKSDKGLFREPILQAIYRALSVGVSLNMAANAARVPPALVRKWLKQGQKEFEELTDEDFENVDDIDEVLTPKAKFYLEINRVKGESVIELQTGLHEKALEGGKEWLATYILERAEPEYYNLKRKFEANVDADVKATNTVQFELMDGFQARPEEDREYILEEMEKLDQQYANDSCNPDNIKRDTDGENSSEGNNS